MLARGLIWDAAEGLARFNHTSGCYTLLLIYMAPVTLPGDPEHIKSGYRVLGAREPHYGQGKPCVGASSGQCLALWLASWAGLWLFWPPRIRTAGQGWKPPKQVGPEHLA